MRRTLRHWMPLLAASLIGAACADLATEPDRAPASIRVTPDDVLLEQGQSFQYTVEVLDGDGRPYERLPAWAPPAWTPEDPGLVAVDASGLATATASGATNLTVEVAGLTAETQFRANPTEMDVQVGFAYITQSVQRRDASVPLVAGRDGVLRVYLTGSVPNFFSPRVRATFVNGGAAVHTVLMDLESGSIPVAIDEGRLSLSLDAPVPGSIIQPGLGLVLELDPDGVVPVAPATALRVPGTGALAFEVRPVTPFRVRLVPVDAPGYASRVTVDDRRNLLEMTEAVFPLDSLDVDVRPERYATTADLRVDEGWYQLIEELYLLRVDDASDRYYYGAARVPPTSGIAGLGYVGYPVSIGLDNDDRTVAHELGHNLNLLHAPCGGPANPDPRYPYADGLIGQFGYDRARDRLLDPESTHDLMSYCFDRVWVSDYNYEKVLTYRDSSAFDQPAAAGVAGDRLVVWGGVRDGELTLEPALEWPGAPVMPEAGGRYRVEGFDAVGAPLFSLAFEPRRLDHVHGSVFAWALPAATAGLERLERLRLTGPEGTVERRRGAGAETAVPSVRTRAVAGRGLAAGRREGRWDVARYPLAVARDPASGAVVALSRTGAIELPDRPVDVTLSDGVRSRRARVER
jgi:hypothetical protein